MLDNYDFSNATKNPFAEELNKNNRSIAEIGEGLEKLRENNQRIGIAKGKIELSNRFDDDFDAMDKEIADEFENDNEKYI